MADGVITGAQTISGIELARITVDLIDKGKEKLEDTIRASFQERGVLAATVNTELKARAHWVSPNP